MGVQVPRRFMTISTVSGPLTRLDDGEVLVVELLRSDLRGGALIEIYDGNSKNSGQLVWRQKLQYRS